MSDPANIRVGDTERDDAVERLQEHAAAGRLSADEFSDRMGKALEARTRGDLSRLFIDLPNHPNHPTAEVAPLPNMSPAPYLRYQPVRPQNQNWWAQWWWVIIVIAVVFAAMRGSPFPLLIIAFVGFSLLKPKASQPDSSGPPRYLTAPEQQEISYAIRAGNKIDAIKRYREITGADLRTAKNSIDNWQRDLGGGR